MTLDASLRLRVDSTEVKEGEKHITKLTYAGKKLDETYRQLGQRVGSKLFVPLSTGATNATTAVKGTEEKLKKFRGVAQQAGYQIQDLAVQLQSGTSAAVAFGQQGSQLAAAFGPTGAVIGAFIAVGAALSGVLIPALGLTGGAIDEMTKKVRDGNAELEKLGDAQRKVFEREQLEQISETEKQIQQYESQLKSAREQIELMEDAERRAALIRKAGYQTDFTVQGANPEQIAKRKQAVLDLEATIEGLNKQLKDEKDLLKQVNSTREADIISRAKSELATSAEANALKSLEAVQRANLTNVETIKDSAREQITILANAYSMDLITLEQYQEQRKLVIENANADIEMENKRHADANAMFLSTSQQTTLSHTGQFFGNLAQIAQAGGKKQFDNYKRMAQAQAGISAALAINSVLGDATLPTFLKIPFATTIGALAAVQIAQIEQQEYQPRALGGQMRANGQYLVGERGPELITMGNRNANITPTNQLGGGESVTQNLVIQVSANTAADVQAQVMRMMPAIQSAALSAVQSQARKGGAFSRSIGAR